MDPPSYDPYDPEINADPYPTYARLREEAPLYHHEALDFYALSRFDDVERALVDHATFSSARGAVLELVKKDVRIPPAMFIFQDPPVHNAYRGVVSRVFTPRKMNALEDQVRLFCRRALEPFERGDRFDFVRDLGAEMPMRVIGMLLGIPEQEQVAVRQHADAGVRQAPGQGRDFSESSFTGEFFAQYVAWREANPGDDLMTELLRVEFHDASGTTRRLTREEILTFVNLLAAAGNETTTRLIGWTGKVLADHPDQRRELVRDRALLANAVEELLRFEPPAGKIARYVTRDVELHGRTVPEGSAMLLLAGAANRDHRVFPDGDRFDISRRIGHHLGFGYGVHFCLGAALARLEGRIALDEVLHRFPEWEVDRDGAVLDSTNVRGWSSLPVVTC